MSTDEDYRALPRIERDNVKILWSDDFWDGPVSGVLLWESKRYYFRVFKDGVLGNWDVDDYTRERTFIVIQLTNAQLEDEEYWHELFYEKVADYGDETGRVGDGVRAREIWDEYYELRKRERKTLELDHNIAVG